MEKAMEKVMENAEAMENEEIMENAGLEAAADSISVKNDTENVNEKISYVIPLSKPYKLDGETIKEVDLSGLEDLTTIDAQEVDGVMSKMKHHPQSKFTDTLYTKHVAMRATGLPIEFFNALSFKDMQNITARVSIYFLF